VTPGRLSPNRGLTRRHRPRERKKRYLICCEGEVTEQEYFDDLRVELRNGLLVLKVRGESRVDPLGLVQLAVAERAKAAAAARRARDENLAFDEVWCVVDVDQHARLPQARDLARREGVELAVSNPCFELWALLHFVDHRSHLASAQARRLLRAHLPTYDKRLDCTALRAGRAVASARARQLDDQAERNGTPGTNPTTGVRRLVDHLRAEAGPS
jgi:hypothetical protein